jgi:hypothetical protein
MKKIITLLEEDFYTSRYINPRDCAIARALIRAEFTNVSTAGDGFDCNEGYGVFPKGTDNIVGGMYRYIDPIGWHNDLEVKPIKPKNLEIVIEFHKS